MSVIIGDLKNVTPVDANAMVSSTTHNGELAADPISHQATGRLPAGYTISPDGIHFEHKAGQAPEWLCSPIAVAARFRAPDGGGWGRIIEVTNPDGAAMIMTVLDRDLAFGWSRASGDLIDHGLCITSRPWGMAALKTLLTKWEPGVSRTSVSKLGWTNAEHTAFVLGSGRVIGSGGVVPMGDIDQHVAAEIREQGTLADWRKRVAEPCIGNPILTLAVSQAFTGPLLGYLGLDLGGGLHLRGASSQGKSTAAMAANSVWGSRRLMSTWRATDNALEGIAATHNGLMLVLDEMGEIDPRPRQGGLPAGQRRRQDSPGAFRVDRADAALAHLPAVHRRSQRG